MAADSLTSQQQKRKPQQQQQQPLLNVSQSTLIVSSPVIITSVSRSSSGTSQSSVMSANSSSIMAAAAEVAAQQQQQAAHHHQQQHSIQHQVFLPTSYGLPQVYQPPHLLINAPITFPNPYPNGANGVSLHLQNAPNNKILAKSVPNHLLQQLKNSSTNAGDGRTTASTSGASAPMIRSATILDPQFTSNAQQTLLIQQFQSSSQQQQQGTQSSLMSSNGKSLTDAQKGKQYMLQANGAAIQPKSQLQIQQQSIMNPQFKSTLQAATQPHPCLSTQFLGPIPPHLNWTSGQPSILIRNQNQSEVQQQLFIQSSTQGVSNIAGTPIYMNPGVGPMHLVSTAPSGTASNLADLHNPIVPTSAIQNLSVSAPTIVSASAVNAFHQSPQNQNKNHLNKNRLSSSSSSSSATSSSSVAIQATATASSLNESSSSKLSNNATVSGHHHITSGGNSTPVQSIGYSQQQSSRSVVDISSSNQSQLGKGLIQKSTQQMNAELLMKSGNNSPKVKQLVRSDSSRSINSQSSAEFKTCKNGGQENPKKSQDGQNNGGKKSDNRGEIPIENIDLSTRSQSNGLSKKSDKKNKLGFQKSSSKPSQVLTHCIDGHIIFESSVPFPVLSNLSRDTLRDRSNGPVTDHETADQRRCLQSFNSAEYLSNENKNDLDASVVYQPLSQQTQQTMSANNKESRKLKKKKAKLKANQAAKAAAGISTSMEEKTIHPSSNIVNGSVSATVGIFATTSDLSGCKTPTPPTTNKISIYTTNASNVGNVQGGNTSVPNIITNQQFVVSNSSSGHTVNVAKPFVSNVTASGVSAMDLDDDSSFVQKQKITSTPLKESKLIELSLNDSSPSSSPPQIQQPPTVEKPVHQWTVDDVYDFVIKISSVEFARILKEHYIDGRALMLLTVPIMKDELKLKLGPVLVLKAKIDELREKFDALNSDTDFLPTEQNIYKWTVKDVYHFVFKLSSKEYAEEFEKQEMDGHALTLLSQEHIMKDMNMQFGPGLKILTKIKQLKEQSDAL